jgi:hypothetical protein
MRRSQYGAKSALMQEYKRVPEAYKSYQSLSEKDQLVIDNCVRDLLIKVGEGMGPASAFSLVHSLGIYFHKKNYPPNA